MGLFDFLSPKKITNQDKPATAANINKSNQPVNKIEPLPGLLIPASLAPHWPEIEKTRLSSVSIKIDKQNDLALEQSKLAHYPCIPIDFDYPKDADGRFMFPLAQINLKEIPALEGYPTSGYLQFYISAFDDMYGLDFDHPQAQKNFRVLFFEEQDVEKYMADFSFLQDIMQSDMMPVSNPHVLTFKQREEFIGFGDVRYEENNQTALRDFIENNDNIEDELLETSEDIFAGKGSKIGGYAFFTQYDPRIDEPQFEDYILLFQLDSEGEICWGDVGVAHFFIHPDDLAKKDFSKVLYHWDCY